MGYVAWSVVFGEQLSAAKWNILGTNDSSFNDGTGIGTNAVAAASLSTSALLLGYSQRTTNVATSGTGNTDAGLTSTVTIPSGTRKVRVHVYASRFANTGANQSNVRLFDGTVAGGTQVQEWSVDPYTGTASVPVSLVFFTNAAPSPGSKTYSAGIQASTGTATLTASATAPAFILVEAV